MDTNGNNNELSNTLALGVAIGEVKAKLVSSEAACLAFQNDVSARLTALEDKFRTVVTGSQLVAAAIGKRLVRRPDETTGEIVLQLVDAPKNGDKPSDKPKSDDDDASDKPRSNGSFNSYKNVQRNYL